VQALLKNPSWKVRGVSRNIDSDKAKALVEEGVEMMTADFDDEESLVRALNVSPYRPYYHCRTIPLFPSSITYRVIPGRPSGLCNHKLLGLYYPVAPKKPAKSNTNKASALLALPPNCRPWNITSRAPYPLPPP
jgi:hypothetical protein